MTMNTDIVLQFNTLFNEEYNLLETAIEGNSLLILEQSLFSNKLLRKICRNANLNPREYTDVFVTSVHLYEKSIILTGFLTNRVEWDMDEYGECFFLKPDATDLNEMYFDCTIDFVKEINGNKKVLEWFLNDEVICDWEDVLKKHDINPTLKLQLMDKDGVRKTVYRNK